MAKKQYSGSAADMEKKLHRVMGRLGVEKYDYNWTQSRGGGNCYVEMLYKGSTYRFENDAQKSAECGRRLTYVSDLFAAVVYSLEGLARAVEQGIFTLDMLLTGVPALPAAEPLEPCFAAMGFSSRPENEQDVKTRYKQLAKVMHPDTGGSSEDMIRLRQTYEECLRLMEDQT